MSPGTSSPRVHLRDEVLGGLKPLTVGLIGAMDEEIELIAQALQEAAKTRIAGSTFYRGRWQGRPVVLGKSGVGKVNAAITAQVMISALGVDRIIFTGVAGGLDPALDMGDIVVSSDCMYHDMDASAIGFPLGTIPFSEESVFAADPGLVERAVRAGKAVHDGRVLIGRILSGDQFISDGQKAARLHGELKGVCVEMEGAAVAHVCARNRVPFVVVRTISDKANGEAPADFSRFVAAASRTSFRLLEKMLEDLP